MYDEKVVDIIGSQFKEHGKCMLHGEYNLGSSSTYGTGDRIAMLLLFYHMLVNYGEQIGLEFDEVLELLKERNKIDIDI